MNVEFDDTIRKTETIRFESADPRRIPEGSITRVNDDAFVVKFEASLGQIWFDSTFTWDQIKEMILNDTWEVNHTDGINAWVIPE